MTGETYNAASICILSPEEAESRFEFAWAGALAEQYQDVSTVFIARLLESCRRSGFPVDDAVRRYLDGDLSVIVSESFSDAYADVLRESRYE